MIRVATLNAPGETVTLRELPLPDLEPGGALLEVECSEVCGTDVHLQDGRLPGVPYPLVPGHVTAGRLARVRGRLHDLDGHELREGDRVTFLDVHRTCHACWYCLVAKATTRCPHRKVYGITYGLADGPSGGWASHLLLKPGTRCIPLGELPARAFMAGGCSLPTSLHALERGALRTGETVLVLGTGPVGLTLAILARQHGAGKVLCIGAPEVRLDMARRAGATDVLDFRQHDAAARRDWVHAHTHGRGADLTFEASGDPQAVVDAMRWTRDAGRVVVVGQYTDGGDVTFNPHHDLNAKHLDVRGCWGSDYAHFHRAVAWMQDADRRQPWDAMPMQAYALEDLDEALARVRAGEVIKALVEPGAAPRDAGSRPAPA